MFVHLHVQSSYSLLSSTVRIKELVEKAKREGYASLALTDRNVMYGSLYFYKECIKQGIRPIIGLLADILEEEGTSHPLLLLAESNQGYHNLLKISSAIRTKSAEGLPVKWLKGYSAGLIAVSPGEGKIQQLLAEGSEEEAVRAAAVLKEIFGPGTLYLGLERVSLPGEAERNEQMIRFAGNTGLPLAALNPVYYLDQDDALARDTLLAIRDGEKLSDDSRGEPQTLEYYLKDKQEMAERFADCPEALENTLAIAGRCRVEIQWNRSLLPKYPDGGEGAEAMLERLCFEGLRQKKPDAPAEYEERLRYELGIIKDMNFSDYFLIVWDFMKFARNKGILTGPGRGSSAGSIVAYTLSITQVDPIEHGLLFERFLNPERVTMPDIDIDFPDNRRDEVIAYVAKKYGELHVAQIVTFGTLAAKAALRDTGRAFGLNPKEIDALSKLVRGRTGTTLDEALQASRGLREFIEESDLNRRLFETARKIEGLPRHTSTHAAGIIISDEPLTDLIAIQSGQEGIHLTQFPMDLLEEIGLLKMDFLGLRNLTLIQDIADSIKKRTGQRADLSSAPLHDPETFKLLAAGDTAGIFQFESEGITRVLKKLKPACFEDVVAVNALYRPGPMDNIPLFIDRKHGLVPIDYPHPDLEEILKDTYGVIVYQEQIMQIASAFAGFSLGEADLLRRAVSKKKKEVLDKERRHFTAGAVKKGYSETDADSIYDMIVRFANYGFPRGHAVAYSMIACQLAWLKAHYPLDFMAALMTASIGNDEKIAQYVLQSRKKGIGILPPSVNKSQYRFTADEGAVRFSLAAIKGVGGTVLKEVFGARRSGPFKDLFDFYIRVSPKIIGRKTMESFVHSGAFDDFGVDRATLLATLDIAESHAELVSPDEDGFGLFTEFEAKYNEVEPIPAEEKLAYEKSVLGFYLSAHPASHRRKLFQHFGAVTVDEALMMAGQRVLAGVHLAAVKTIRTKKGEQMAFLTVSDEGGDMEAVAFPDLYKTSSHLLKQGSLVLLQGHLEERQDRKQLVIEQVFPLDRLLELEGEKSSLFIKIEAGRQDPGTLKKIKQLLQKNNGTTEVLLYYEGEHRYIRLPLWDWVKPSEALISGVEKIAGKGNVILKKE